MFRPFTEVENNFSRIFSIILIVSLVRSLQLQHLPTRLRNDRKWRLQKEDLATQCISFACQRRHRPVRRRSPCLR
ncbi:hypothetical protein V1508DRAFT_429290 [Lipomyces doorenjongii]|uniref:uncharacterized protein n=1 Tax=Lipomyces doorenjongii TaxID=383834 RepID=UPI0034CDDF77